MEEKQMNKNEKTIGEKIKAWRKTKDLTQDALAKKAVANNMTEKEIKMAIKNWKADEYRA